MAGSTPPQLRVTTQLPAHSSALSAPLDLGEVEAKLGAGLHKVGEDCEGEPLHGCELVVLVIDLGVVSMTYLFET